MRIHLTTLATPRLALGRACAPNRDQGRLLSSENGAVAAAGETLLYLAAHLLAPCCHPPPPILHLQSNQVQLDQHPAPDISQCVSLPTLPYNAIAGSPLGAASHLHVKPCSG